MPFSGAGTRSTETTSAIIWCGEQAIVSTCSWPASIFERSSTSLISSSRCLPLERIVFRKSCRSCFVAAVGAADQQLGEAEDAVERRANLVAHVGEELALGAVGGLGLISLARLISSANRISIRVVLRRRACAFRSRSCGSRAAGTRLRPTPRRRAPASGRAGGGDAEHAFRPPDAADEMIDRDDGR